MSQTTKEQELIRSLQDELLRTKAQLRLHQKAQKVNANASSRENGTRRRDRRGSGSGVGSGSGRSHCQCSRCARLRGSPALRTENVERTLSSEPNANSTAATAAAPTSSFFQPSSAPSAYPLPSNPPTLPSAAPTAIQPADRQTISSSWGTYSSPSSSMEELPRHRSSGESMAMSHGFPHSKDPIVDRQHHATVNNTLPPAMAPTRSPSPHRRPVLGGGGAHSSHGHQPTDITPLRESSSSSQSVSTSMDSSMTAAPPTSKRLSYPRRKEASSTYPSYIPPVQSSAESSFPRMGSPSLPPPPSPQPQPYHPPSQAPHSIPSPNTPMIHNTPVGTLPPAHESLHFLAHAAVPSQVPGTGDGPLHTMGSPHSNEHHRAHSRHVSCQTPLGHSSSSSATKDPASSSSYGCARPTSSYSISSSAASSATTSTSSPSTVWSTLPPSIASPRHSQEIILSPGGLPHSAVASACAPSPLPCGRGSPAFSEGQRQPPSRGPAIPPRATIVPPPHQNMTPSSRQDGAPAPVPLTSCGTPTKTSCPSCCECHMHAMPPSPRSFSAGGAGGEGKSGGRRPTRMGEESQARRCAHHHHHHPHRQRSRSNSPVAVSYSTALPTPAVKMLPPAFSTSKEADVTYRSSRSLRGNTPQTSSGRVAFSTERQKEEERVTGVPQSCAYCGHCHQCHPSGQRSHASPPPASSGEGDRKRGGRAGRSSSTVYCHPKTSVGITHPPHSPSSETSFLPVLSSPATPPVVQKSTTSSVPPLPIIPSSSFSTSSIPTASSTAGDASASALLGCPFGPTLMDQAHQQHLRNAKRALAMAHEELLRAREKRMKMARQVQQKK